MRYGLNILGATFLLSACSGESIEHAHVKVDSQPAVCTGEAQQMCLHIMHSGDTQWSWHYGGIQGFDYKWGFHYTLAYAKNEIEDPPADGSSVEWVLLDIISQTEDAIGTEYDFNAVTMREFTITATDGDYAFIGYPFTCAEGLDCDSLIMLTGSNQNVDLRFRYLGDTRVALVSWE